MITVLAPGFRTLVQDAGRTGYEHLGVPTSGAACPDLYERANFLVGNADGAAALEVLLSGPTLLFSSDTIVAYVGPPADLHLNDTRVSADHAHRVRAGDMLSVSTLREGVYGYLSVAGGIQSTPVLGSRSSCTLSGLGPAPLGANDTLSINSPDPTNQAIARTELHRCASHPIRFVRGPHADMFDANVYARLSAASWTIHPNSSRVGVRLAGEPLSAPKSSIPSLGMVTGAIQVPPSGEPIILGPDHGTTGGYPVIAVITAPDMSTLMQRRSGQPVTLVETTIVENRARATSGAGRARHVNLDLLHA